MKYIQVVGGPGSGKTTLAIKLANKYGLGYIELDELFWKENWQQSSYDEFIQKIQSAMDAHPEGWVIDGSYTGMVGSYIQPKLEVLVYLQIPPHITIPRALRRSFKRARTGELLWGKNEEKFSNALKLAWWTAKSYRSRVSRMQELKKTNPQFEMHIFRSNKEANGWLEKLPLKS